jgi:formylglycine-generating enzyme required for sulfatase activity
VKEKEIYKSICNLLNDIVETSNGDVLSAHLEKNNPIKIWKHIIHFPRKEEDSFYLLLPNENETIEISETVISGKYYIIDCFEKYKGNERKISPRSFLVNFLFNSDGYFTFLRENSIFKDIENLYTTRSIFAFNVLEEHIFSKSGNNLEKKMEEWESQGSNPLLILGERGIGKSWAVLNFCLKQSKPHNENPWETPLPIYVNLRLLCDGIPTVTNLGELLFYHLTTRYGIRIFGGYPTFLTLLHSGRLLLVLDGLDEMSKEMSEEIALKNLWQIFSLFSNTSKFILTSRRNFFKSEIQIKEHFAYEQYIALKSNNNKSSESIYNIEERRIRQDFHIWIIETFEFAAKANFLEKISNLSSERLQKGREKLEKLSKFKDNTIQKELYLLCDTPSYILPLIKMLASNSEKPLVDIFELCIDSVIIDFNIETERGIANYKTLDSVEGTTSIKVNKLAGKDKNGILRKLSWYMVERNIDNFNIVEFPKFLKEVEGNDYEVILNDLQTQTVITLDKIEEKYSFLTESIFAFYVANYLFFQLCNEEESEIFKGIRNLGRYSSENHLILSKAFVFLKAKIEAFCEEEKGKKQFKVICDLSSKTFQNDSPYSPWLQYLSHNLECVGINVNQEILEKRDFWSLNPISTPNNKTDEKMVLISGDEIKPFFIGVTEITNKEYLEFLDSHKINGTRQESGHHWRRSQAFGENKNLDNPYLNIINYYHIIFWTEDEIPMFKEDHPLVWISWFAAAKFCNWLSRKEGFRTFYNFELIAGKFNQVTVDKESYGYRLPSEEEWIFAASNGISDAVTLLDLYSDEKDKEMIRSRFSQTVDSTSPVRSENPNKFGVYGLMGNVREWVDDVDEKKDKLTEFTEQLIKGMGWLLGKEGFEFKHSSPLIAQNNNVDVGFRIARSLSPNESEKVKLANSSE